MHAAEPDAERAKRDLEEYFESVASDEACSHRVSDARRRRSASAEVRRFAARVTVQCAGAAPREATIQLAYVYWLFPPSTGELDDWELLIDDWELLIGSDSPSPGDVGR